MAIFKLVGNKPVQKDKFMRLVRGEVKNVSSFLKYVQAKYRVHIELVSNLM